MKRLAPPSSQRGVALWMLLILVAMTGGYAFYRSANSQFNRVGQDAKLAATLVRAKEALIAYAVTDGDRPGSLPCPDLSTNNAGFNNVPGDGKTDMFTVNQCPIYVGWLPWVTLDLPELTDDTGTRLWYVLAPALRNHDSAHPINSDTPTGLMVDGNSNDIAALIIAPREPVGAQNRPSHNPADYLEGENANGNDHKYVTGQKNNNFNDAVLVITRQELMAAVERRVANEVRSCLTQHAASSANTNRRYPWPAPLSANGFQGKANSLFGRVPATQPDAGPEAALKASITKLSQTLNLLTTAPDASQQLTALNGLGDAILQTRNLVDAIFSISNKLKQVADDAVSQLTLIETAVSSAVANGRISRAEGTALRALTSSTDATQDSLTDLLAQGGVDVFPWQLGQLSSALGGATAPGDIAAITQSIRDLLRATTTLRPDIAPFLETARNAAITTCNETASLLLPCEASTAQAGASSLIGTLRALNNSVENSRVSQRASEVSTVVSPLTTLSAAIHDAPSTENTVALQATLTAAKTSIDSIATGVSAVISTRNDASAALTAAINSLQISPSNNAAIDTNAATAIGKISALVNAIADNEVIDNNVSHTSLLATISAYENARTAFAQEDTANPRPRQANITPYASTLGNAAVNIKIWAKIISANAALIAPLAKANPVTADINPNEAAVLDTSAYKLANDALASIAGKNESSTLLQAYISTPSAVNQATAIAALAETTGLVSSLLTAAFALDNPLSSTTASAFPLVWLSSRCDFLLPKATWWSNNQWANTVFYQINSATMSEPGKLTVNGSGSYRVVALAAGRALATQNRGTLTVANFLEGINAHTSRDGNATAPAISFTSTLPSATFNDRLAY